MQTRDIARLRMHNQRLWGTSLKGPEEVVGWLGAMQAQEFQVAKWAVAQRAEGVDDATMDRAFADGAILRTHLLRPTWHFVRPADIRWVLRATAPRVHALNAHYYRKLGLDDELLARTNAVLADAVEGGRHRTRKELVAVLDRAGIDASGLRLGYILMRAELDAVLCSGAPSGKQQTYASLDERAPDAHVLDRDEALAELAGRYFVSRGPATVKDLSRWASLTVAEATRSLEMVRSGLEHEVVGGRTYWFAPSSADDTTAQDRIDLIQGLDELVMSYSESRDVLLPVSVTTPVSDDVAFAWFAIVLDGRLVGHWRRAPGSSPIVLETALYRPLRRFETRELDAAVDRYSRFLGLPVTLASDRTS